MGHLAAKFSKVQLGIALALVTSLGYAFLPIVSISIYQQSEITPIGMLFWRFTIAMIILWGILLPFPTIRAQVRAIKLPELGLILSTGGIFAFVAWTAFIALDMLSATTYTVILHLYPALTVLISFALGERGSARLWLAVGMGLAGVIFVTGAEMQFSSGLGAIFAFFNATLYALYLIAIMRFVPSVTPTAYMMLNTTGVWMTATLIAVITRTPVEIPIKIVPEILALGVFVTVIPGLSMLVSTRLIGASKAAVIAASEPAVTLVFAVLLLNEAVGLPQLLGVSLIILSVVSLNNAMRRQAKVA